MILIRSLLVIALAVCATLVLVKIVVVFALAGAVAALALAALRFVRRLTISGTRRSVVRGVRPLPNARISVR